MVCRFRAGVEPWAGSSVLHLLKVFSILRGTVFVSRGWKEEPSTNFAGLQCDVEP